MSSAVSTAPRRTARQGTLAALRVRNTKPHHVAIISKLISTLSSWASVVGEGRIETGYGISENAQQRIGRKGQHGERRRGQQHARRAHPLAQGHRHLAELPAAAARATTD